MLIAAEECYKKHNWQAPPDDLLNMKRGGMKLWRRKRTGGRNRIEGEGNGQPG